LVNIEFAKSKGERRDNFRGSNGLNRGIECYECGERGHIARDCRNRRDRGRYNDRRDRYNDRGDRDRDRYRDRGDRYSDRDRDRDRRDSADRGRNDRR
jgi:hypothetical protein